MLLHLCPGSMYSSPSSVGRLSDTTSPIYPDRPIRPLPKRRLRSRLSPEVAKSILHPATSPNSKTSSHISFSESPSYADETGIKGIKESIRWEGSPLQLNSNQERPNGYLFRGNDLGSDDEDVGIVRQGQRPSTALLSRNHLSGSVRSEVAKSIKSPTTHPAAPPMELVDGYDSFENTNNKKKRKIPTSGSLGVNQSTLSADMAHMGLSSPQDIGAAPSELDVGVGQYYGTGSSAVSAISSGNGLSGAGRGRYARVSGRTPSGRSPLAVSSNGSNILLAGQTTVQRDYPTTKDYGGENNGAITRLYRKANINVETALVPDRGIISAAIANAAALPTTPTKGQEHVSLLDQHPSRKASSSKTQFTFTCDSDSAKAMVWPEVHITPSDASYPGRVPKNSTAQTSQGYRGVATQGTQTSPIMAGQSNNTTSNADIDNSNSQQSRKSRSSLAKHYALAARKRRLKQDNKNYRHPPCIEDIWICQFCEYESIFGSPPEALVQLYEVKDRRERRRLAEKRRLLEKAKMKGRKGKKGSKAPTKNVNTIVQGQQQEHKQRNDHLLADQNQTQNQGTQSEDCSVNNSADDLMSNPAVANSGLSQVSQVKVLDNQDQHSVLSRATAGIEDNNASITA